MAEINYINGYEIADAQAREDASEALNNTNRINSVDADLQIEKTTRQFADNNLQNQINSLASGSPKGTYATKSALETANPETGVYIITADGHVYSWTKDAESAIDLGIYQAAEIDIDKTLTLKETPAEAKAVGDHIFGSESADSGYVSLELNVGKYYDSNGNMQSANDFVCAEYNIPNNYDYIKAAFRSNSGWTSKTFFEDMDGNIIKIIYGEDYSEHEYEIPKDAVKIKISSRTINQFVPTLKFFNKYIPKTMNEHEINKFIFTGMAQSKFKVEKINNKTKINITAGNIYFCFGDMTQYIYHTSEALEFELNSDETLIFDLDDKQFKIIDWSQYNQYNFEKNYIVMCHNSNGYPVAGFLAQIYNNKKLESLQNYNYLYGKKIIAIGDSMTKGHTLSNSQTWLYKIAKRNNMTSVNYGKNGVALSYNSTYSGGYPASDSVVARYSSMDDDADYIIVFAGTNDIRNGIAMGTDDSTDNTSFKGALNVLCKGLIDKYPNKHIMFITPYAETYGSYTKEIAQSYIDAIKTICKKYNIPVFDNSTIGGIDFSNDIQKATLTLGDNTHLNETGMEYVSYKYENFVRSL